MIKLNRIQAPTELDPATAAALTAEYAISGKDVWNKTYIRQTLLRLSNKKCAYCECYIAEESKYMEVDHFRPKSSHPDKVVQWDNLLPSCKRCNVNKWSYDVDVEGQIIDPTIQNPNDHLYLLNFQFRDKDVVGRNSIDVCNLNETDRLFMVRVLLSVEINNSLYEIRENLETYIAGSRSTRSKNAITRGVSRLLELAGPTKQYSATIATLLLLDPTYIWIKTELNLLGLWAGLQAVESAAIPGILRGP